MAGGALSAFLRFVAGTGECTEDAELGELILGDAFVTFNTWFQEWGRRTLVPRRSKR